MCVWVDGIWLMFLTFPPSESGTYPRRGDWRTVKETKRRNQRWRSHPCLGVSVQPWCCCGPRHTQLWPLRTKCRFGQPCGYQRGRWWRLLCPKDGLAGREKHGMMESNMHSVIEKQSLQGSRRSQSYECWWLLWDTVLKLWAPFTQQYTVFHPKTP